MFFPLEKLCILETSKFLQENNYLSLQSQILKNLKCAHTHTVSLTVADSTFVCAFGLTLINGFADIKIFKMVVKTVHVYRHTNM